MARIKRPKKKFYTAPRTSPRFRWWWAQKDKVWEENTDPINPPPNPN